MKLKIQTDKIIYIQLSLDHYNNSIIIINALKKYLNINPPEYIKEQKFKIIEKIFFQ